MDKNKRDFEEAAAEAHADAVEASRLEEAEELRKDLLSW